MKSSVVIGEETTLSKTINDDQSEESCPRQLIPCCSSIKVLFIGANICEVTNV